MMKLYEATQEAFSKTNVKSMQYWQTVNRYFGWSDLSLTTTVRQDSMDNTQVKSSLDKINTLVRLYSLPEHSHN